jgi:hypothetical protein
LTLTRTRWQPGFNFVFFFGLAAETVAGAEPPGATAAAKEGRATNKAMTDSANVVRDNLKFILPPEPRPTWGKFSHIV